LEYLRANPEIDLIGCQAWKIDEAGTVIGEIRKPVMPDQVDRYMRYACPVVHPTYFVKKEVYKSLGGYRTDLRATEDLEFLLRARRQGFRIANLPEKLLSYRVSSGSVSQRNVKAQMIETRHLLQAYRRPGQPEAAAPRLGQAAKSADEWFIWAWKGRLRMLHRAAQFFGPRRAVFLVLAGLYTCSHPELLASSARALLSKRSL
jgi:hypothetical protein